jgi:hypothetical protein
LLACMSNKKCSDPCVNTCGLNARFVESSYAPTLTLPLLMSDTNV